MKIFTKYVALCEVKAWGPKSTLRGLKTSKSSRIPFPEFETWILWSLEGFSWKIQKVVLNEFFLKKCQNTHFDDFFWPLLKTEICKVCKVFEEWYKKIWLLIGENLFLGHHFQEFCLELAYFKLDFEHFKTVWIGFSDLKVKKKKRFFIVLAGIEKKSD